MDLTSVETIKNLLSKYNTHPNKIMGQNFLVDKTAFDKIMETAQLNSTDTVLEIGPGIGNLTIELAKKVKRVIAIEKDRIMVEILKETLKEYLNVEIIKEDILKFPISNIQFPKYKVVANIPYYLTSPVIRKFLESENGPDEMILMVQKEVAQRICSTVPNMSLLAVSVQFYAKVEIISYISKECFWPSPKVDSAIILLTPSKIADQRGIDADLRGHKKLHKNIDIELFFKLVKAGFSQPRKQLANNLSKSLGKDKNQTNLWLLKNKINPEQRAGTLSILDWKNLSNSYEPNN